MKHNISLMLRAMALIVMIFAGITAIIPQSTAPENDEGLPVWTDLTEENRDYLRTVYKNYLMEVADGNAFGVDMPMTAFETAYASVALHEALSGLDGTFEEYREESGADYIKKAVEYELWHEAMPSGQRQITREELGLAIAPFVTDTASGYDTVFNGDTYKEPEKMANMFNLGITPSTRQRAAFSPTVTATRGDAAMMYAMVIDPSLRIKIEPKDFAQLEIQLKDTMSEWKGDWSLYFEDYDSGQSISINSHQVYSASLIKLFVANAVYDGIANGKLSESGAVTDNLRKMITYSDNNAWSYLARVLGGGSYKSGMGKMTDFAQNNGYADTGTFYKGSHRNFNFTSVNDCGAFLGNLLDGEMISPEYSQKLLDLMKEQQVLHKIPAGIPDSVSTANKTGELDYMQGDVAIVYAPSGTYILCIIGDDLTNGYGQTDKFVELSKMVYEYTNQ